MKHKIIKSEERYYSENLSNYHEVCRETNNAIIENYTVNYNCMSYAFDCFNNFMQLHNFGDYYVAPCDTIEEEISELNYFLDDFILEILKYTNVREIKNPYQANPEDERVIAFRLSRTDFHFARLGEDGIWTHKPGSTAIKTMTEDQFFDPRGWCWQDRSDPYLSDIVYFALKKNAEYQYREEEEDIDASEVLRELLNPNKG